MNKKVLHHGRRLLEISATVLAIAAMAVLLYRLAWPNPARTQETVSIHNNPEGKVRITFAYRKNGAGDEMENSIRKYNETNTDSIEVEIIKIPEDKYDETLNMYFTSGGAPNVFEIGSEWLDTYVTKNWISDLKSYCSEEFLGRFPDWVDRNIHERYSANDSIYSLPASELTIRLIYNRELFRMAGLNPYLPPTTMDELKAYALKISKFETGSKKYGFALNAGDGQKCFERYLEGANTYNGINYYDFKQGRYDLPVYTKWFETIREMRDNESLFPGETILRESNALMQFKEGNIGMMYIDSSALKTLAKLKGEKAVCDWDVAMPPALEEGTAGKGKISVIPSAFYCVSSTCRNMDAAAAFWKYLYSDEHMGDMYREGVQLPIIGSVAENPDYTPDVKNLNRFLPGKIDSVYPVPPRAITDWSRFDAYIEAIDGTMPVDRILKNENDNLNYQFNLVIDGGQIDSNDYVRPEFDWLDPLKRR